MESETAGDVLTWTKRLMEIAMRCKTDPASLTEDEIRRVALAVLEDLGYKLKIEPTSKN